MALSKQQQQQVALVVMVTVGFFYVYWNYMLKPANDKIKKVDAELTQVLEKVEVMKRTANRLPALQREYDELMAEVGKAEKRLPKQKNIQEILRVVTDHAIKNHVYIQSLSPAPEVTQNYFIEIPFNISFTGTFHSIGKFLTVMGQQERIMSARNVSFSYALNEKRGHSVSGSFTLLAYIFKG